MTEQQISEPETPKGTFEEGKATARRLFEEDPGSQFEWNEKNHNETN